MSDDDELYDKFIAMWDKREYTLDLQVREIVDEIMTEIYNETGGDKERCLAIFKKALENYNEGAYTWSTLYQELDDFERGEGNWIEEEDEEED
jgi:hypothetical protein